jgi:hypothetical protein
MLGAGLMMLSGALGLLLLKFIFVGSGHSATASTLYSSNLSLWVRATCAIYFYTTFHIWRGWLCWKLYCIYFGLRKGLNTDLGIFGTGGISG